MTGLLLLVGAFLASPARGEDVRDSLHRIEQSQAVLNGKVDSLAGTMGDMKQKQKEFDASMGRFYRENHIPTRDQWAKVADKGDVKTVTARLEASLNRIDRLESKDDLLMGAWILAGVLAGLGAIVLGWFLNGLNIRIKAVDAAES